MWDEGLPKNECGALCGRGAVDGRNDVRCHFLKKTGCFRTLSGPGAQWWNDRRLLLNPYLDIDLGAELLLNQCQRWSWHLQSTSDTGGLSEPGLPTHLPRVWISLPEGQEGVRPLGAGRDGGTP